MVLYILITLKTQIPERNINSLFKVFPTVCHYQVSTTSVPTSYVLDTKLLMRRDFSFTPFRPPLSARWCRIYAYKQSNVTSSPTTSHEFSSATDMGKLNGLLRPLHYCKTSSSGRQKIWATRPPGCCRLFAYKAGKLIYTQKRLVPR